LILKNLSFIVNGGSKVGVVGRTGSGKSTTALALPRIIELADGCIEIDGKDIAKISMS
jgi:ABC-type multidrug transport system fused ATPase/permease subunit